MPDAPRFRRGRPVEAANPPKVPISPQRPVGVASGEPANRPRLFLPVHPPSECVRESRSPPIRSRELVEKPQSRLGCGLANRNQHSLPVDKRLRGWQYADRLSVPFGAHDDLADHSAAESYGDHHAQETALGVVDLFAPELTWPHLRNQHKPHATRVNINEPSTFALGVPRILGW